MTRSFPSREQGAAQASTWASQEVGAQGIRNGRRIARSLMWSLAIAVGTLVASAITMVAVLNVKLRKYKVKRRPLTPGRKALIAEAYGLYRAQTPKNETIARLRTTSNGDRSACGPRRRGSGRHSGTTTRPSPSSSSWSRRPGPTRKATAFLPRA
jgi:hypothetical protein